MALLFSCGGGGDDPNTPTPPPEEDTIPEDVQAIIDSINIKNVKFNDRTVTYDGTAHRITASGVSYLPKGVSVETVNNGKTEAGEHTVECKLIYTHTDGKSYHFTSLFATLTIRKASYDMSGIRFNDATLTYNGEPRSVLVTGTLPGGVTVEYIGNGQTNAGTYTVTARFTGNPNYNPIADKTATLTIDKADYDMSEVYLLDKTVGYDSASHGITYIGTLPEGVTVNYIGNGKSAVGTYTVTAKFSSDNPNYNPIADKTATLTISASKLAGVSICPDPFVYNGTEPTLTVTGTLPPGYTVDFEHGEMINAGTYSVVAKFYEGGAYKPEYDLTASVVILKAELSLSASDLIAEYDGNEKSIELIGTLPEGITVVEYGNGRIAPGVYRVIFRLVTDTPSNFKNLSDITATLTITEKEIGATNGLVFEINGNKCTVVGYNGTDSVVNIPAEHEGKSVVSIKSEAFFGNTAIKYVIIPDSVTNIGNSAFRGCTALREVTFGNSVKVIGLLAFEGTAITEVRLTDSLELIGHGAFRATPMESMTLPFIGASRSSSSKYLGYIFGADDYPGNLAFVPKTLISLTLTDGCKDIPAYSLYGCSSLERVYIGSGVTEIGISAFMNCTALKSVYIPASVKTIPAAAEYYNSPFFGCSEELVIVIGHASAPSYNATPSNPDGTGFAEHWNKISADKTATTVVNKTYDEYLLEYNG